ncbi:SusC/RagA family TonB-linked outer membrane protein [Pedobacter sp. ASV28]|uniref:SusC/RagA family TonB-linked outer membrane protein n=1 Tax=Pedobacter sp. ASV28 TaxID=2795123 RepID=UPI0018EE1F3E|nr:SusC/RagA family TonB-linked outer membrane protein [Pedobacter sp. ASV28]
MNFFNIRRHAPPRWPVAGRLHGKFPEGLKTKIIMRINLVILSVTIACLQVAAASVNAQSITLKVNNEPIKTVFEKIRKQSGYLFFYRNVRLKEAANVSLELKNVPLREALDRVMNGQPFTYDIVENTIVILEKEKKPAQGSNRQTVNGQVFDEQDKPLAGASVAVKGTDRKTTTDAEGRFRLADVEENATLIVSYIGFQTREVKAGNNVVIRLQSATANLNEVSVVSTGYQSLPKERATGSFVQIDNQLIDRRVGTNILDRLDGVTSGLIFNSASTKTQNDRLGINIRGRSTIDVKVNASPLVVVDNFPYEGDINNINPNDVESITILKDAAAAAIWGARSGNGVIVITTKKGRYNDALNIQFNSNITIGAKPDLFYSPDYLNAAETVELERTLFNFGYFDNDLANTVTWPVLSPVVELLAQKRANPALANEVEAKLAALKDNDLRNDYDKYVYRNSVFQQNSLGLRGGSAKAAYSVSLGYDNNKSSLIRTGSNRLTLNSFTSLKPTNNLEITFGLNYVQNSSENNATQFDFATVNQGIGNKWGRIFPYARLADDEGNHLNVERAFRTSYLVSAQNNGLLNWRYSPLDEIDQSDNTSKINNVLFRTGVKYRIFDFLSTEVQYQLEKQNSTTRNYRSQQTFYTRDLINRFSQYNSSTKTYTYPFPMGGILELNKSDLTSNNLRWQLNFDHHIGKDHQVNAIAGAEIREVKTGSIPQYLWGYNDDFGTSVNNINPTISYPNNPSGSATLPLPSVSVGGTTNRYVSYYTAATYSYKERYLISASARKDGANIFGVKTNDKVVPLWSAGVGYQISKEDFYPLAFLPYAKLRATYGFNGNVYNASAYLTAQYATSSLTGLQYANITAPPNPELSWEKVKNINIGFDFATKGDIISGSIELYRKYGLDLIESAPLAPSTGFQNFQGNAASTLTKGIDIVLNSRNLTGKLKWNTNFLLSTQKDKVTAYDPTFAGSTLATGYNLQTPGSPSIIRPVVGKPLFAIFSYQWAGIDPANGDPQGYLNGAVSKDYLAILNSANANNLIFNGSAVPTVYGSLRNSFSYKNISVSANITYKLGYYFRKRTTALNYQGIDLLSHSDYVNRWQKPGDELNSNVPSLVYLTNANRTTFYQHSEILVEKADHVRLQDISLDYNIDKTIWKRMPFRSFQPYVYAKNLGLLWRANKSGLDPDYIVFRSYPEPLTVAFGLRVGLN